MLSTLTFWATFVRARLAAARRDDERGVSLVELVIIAAGVAVLALAVVNIISGLVTDKAESINLG